MDSDVHFSINTYQDGFGKDTIKTGGGTAYKEQKELKIAFCSLCAIQKGKKILLLLLQASVDQNHAAAIVVKDDGYLDIPL